MNTWFFIALFTAFILTGARLMDQRDAYERCEKQFSRATCENILR